MTTRLTHTIEPGSLGIASVSLSTDGRVINANQLCSELFELPPQQLGSRIFSEMFSEDQRLEIESFIKSSVETTDQPVKTGICFISQSGKGYWLELHARSSIDPDSGEKAIQVLILDASAYAASERELKRLNRVLEDERNIFVQGNVVVFKWINAEGWPVEYVSPNVASVFGYSSDQFYSAEVSYADLIHPEDLSRVIQEVVANSQSGATDFEHKDYRIKHSSGREVWLHDYTNILRNAEGEVTHYLGYVVDITEQKRVALELAKKDKIDSVGVLAGGIAHDFNNFLTGILGNLELALMNDSLPPVVRGHLLEAASAGTRAQSLTKQLLTFSKGGAPVKRRSDILEVVKDSASFPLRGSSTQLHIDSDLPAANLDIDRGQISQVVHNLVLNSRQAMSDAGSIIIDVSVVDTPEALQSRLHTEKALRLSFKDEGPGISADIQKLIFDPYFTTKLEGNGLGLSICYSIVNAHNGHICVESKLGEGSEFIIHLPYSTGVSLEPGVLPDRKAPLGGARVLVMDDQLAIQTLLEKGLTTLGYQVDCVDNGEQAIGAYIQALQNDDPYDAVILDLTIPGSMGGRETIGRLLKLDPGVRALVSSGYSEDPVMSNYTDFGFVEVVSKPFGLKEMAAKIDRAIDGRYRSKFGLKNLSKAVNT